MRMCNAKVSCLTQNNFGHHRRNFVHVLWVSVVAWVFSVVSVAACTFVKSGLESASYRDLAEFGLFNYNFASDERQCVSYGNTVNYSAAAKTARAFGVICCLLTGFAMIQALSLQLFLRSNRELVWKSTRILLMAAPLAQLLTFTTFGDDVCLAPNVKCVPGAAGIIAILNVFVLVALAVVCCITPPPAQPLYEIKRLEAPPMLEQKPTIAEDIETDGQSIEEEQKQAIFSYSRRIEKVAPEDIEAQPEQVIASNFERNEVPSNDVTSPSKRSKDLPEELDAVVRSVGADVDEAAYPKSVRPISTDSERRRLSFLPRRSSKGKSESSGQLEV